MLCFDSGREQHLSAFEKIAETIIRRHAPEWQTSTTRCNITNGMMMPVGGGHTESTVMPTNNPASSASGDGDDGGGDPDPEPERRRYSSKTKTLPRSCGDSPATASPASSPASPPPSSDFALWRLPTVLQHVPISRSSWWAGVKCGRYPQPVRLSPRCVAWRASDIRALVESF